MIGRYKRRSSIKQVALGSALAAAAGYIAGLLTAPKSGKQTREDLRQVANKSWAEAEKDLKQLHTELGKVIDEAKARSDTLSGKTRKELDRLLERAQDTKEKVREMISAIREGDAADKDLAKAIKDATTALDHLRAYLKK